MDLIIVISISIGLLIGLICYALFVPKRNSVFSPDNDEVTKNNIILKMATVVGSEIYSALPEQNRPNSKNSLDSVRTLLVKSGNPWQLKPQEFLFLRWITALFGGVIGGVLYLFLIFSSVSFIPWYALIIGGAVFGFFIPSIIHNEKARERDLAFKQQLPEALNLIIISTSSQKILPDAIRESVDNMKPGILRNEFVNILRSVDSGRSMRDALDDFADRAPNEGVLTFVTSLQEALDVNVDITELLKSRAETSRQELTSLVKTRIANLSVSISVVLFPALLLAFLLTVISPSVSEFLKTFQSI